MPRHAPRCPSPARRPGRPRRCRRDGGGRRRRDRPDPDPHPLQPRRPDLRRQRARRDHAAAPRPGQPAEGHPERTQRDRALHPPRRRAPRGRGQPAAAGLQPPRGHGAPGARRAADDHQPSQRRSRVLRSAGPAVVLPAGRARLQVQPAAAVHLPLPVDRPDEGRPAALRPGEPTVGRGDDDHRRGRHGAVHRPSGAGLPGPRPVQDPHPLHARARRGAAGRPSASGTTSSSSPAAVGAA